MKAWRLALVAILICATLYGSFTALDDGVWSLHQSVGLAILIPAFCLWALAHRQLGSSFTVRAEARQLVTRGLYSRIRNPIYVFGWILAVGLVTFLWIPLLYILLVALVPVQVLRARREARVLEAAYGDAYRRYKRQTWF
jgi:protein-S-isoprenylcysteine O-methyltransferase Ste14